MANHDPDKRSSPGRSSSSSPWSPQRTATIPTSPVPSRIQEQQQQDTSLGRSGGLAGLRTDSTEQHWRLTRNTTVMTLHSDSESEYEHSQQGFELEQQSTLFPASNSYEFDSGLNSVLSSGYHIDPSHLSAGSFQNGQETSTLSSLSSSSTRATPYRRFAFQGQGPVSSEDDDDDDEEEGDEAESTEDENQRDAADMFNQDSDVNFTDGDDDEDSEVSDPHASPRSNVLGSYLLQPMGFDDDDDSAETATGVEGLGEAAERFQIFAGVNEFDQSDHIGLNDAPYQVIPKTRKRDQERILENKRRQGKLLLVSLLDNFCLLYDQSPERNRKLFYVICKTLSNMGIIDEEYLEEMSAVRSSYQRAFKSLVLSALTSIKQEQMIMDSRRIMAPPSTPTDNADGEEHDRTGNNRGPDMNSQDISQSFSDTLSSSFLHTPVSTTASLPSSASMMRTQSFSDMFDHDDTRYKHDFIEICKLGKGGFASVFKARDKLDGIEYAIKKVRLRGNKVRFEKIFREIKFLARLEHKNVIRYHSSWLENADYPVSKRELYGRGGHGGGHLESQGDLDDEYDDDEYGDEDEYTNTMSMAQDEISSTEDQGIRRKSIDYFSPHTEQHAEHPEDLSMGIVFGDDDDYDYGDDINFEYSQGEHSSNGHDSKDVIHSVSQHSQGEDMERTHSASSTLTSRAIPRAAPRRKHQSPTVSQEMQGRTLTWDKRDNNASGTSSKTHKESSRHSVSNSFSALSSSIEEIQRSLPSSFSGSGGHLGSRFGHSPSSRDRNLELALKPLSFPGRREVDKRNFAGGGLGGLHGMSSSARNDPREHRKLRNSTGQLVTRDLTLFIKLQLCQTTLQDYLVYRNERPTAVPKRSRKEMLSRRMSSKAGKGRFGILAASASDEQTTHSTPGSPPPEQTCHKDLVDPAVNQHIFREIVEGVAYIHDQDMIHRDLKPSNIFLGMPAGSEHHSRSIRQDVLMNENMSPGAMMASSSFSSTLSGLPGAMYPPSSPRLLISSDPYTSPPVPLTKEQIQEALFMNIETMVPKIGDFGLVTDMEGGATMEAENGSSSTQGPGNTPSLGSRSSSSSTAPMLRRHSSAADIYSLGIIFFELYHPFSTLMERHAVLKTLRNGELPPDFVSRWPKEAAFVLWLMAEDPRIRPSAREILEFDLIKKPKEELQLPLGGPSPSISPTNGGSKSDSKRRKSTEKDSRSDLLGLGLLDPGQSANGGTGTGRVLCKGCQVKCRCITNQESPSCDPETNTSDTMQASCSNAKSHRRSGSRSVEKTMTDPKLLTEPTEKVKRLEQSLAALRAENKALLDRIQELEFEKAQSSWNGSTTIV
ncbi:hypothetical protein BGZ83_002735 [Gryganskiella cystojenkinii]|nr:hypothetical protein BGZ83_002735 [Gryganskiella cystojenkinii]